MCTPRYQKPTRGAMWMGALMTPAPPQVEVLQMQTKKCLPNISYT